MLAMGYAAHDLERPTANMSVRCRYGQVSQQPRQSGYTELRYARSLLGEYALATKYCLPRHANMIPPREAGL